MDDLIARLTAATVGSLHLSNDVARVVVKDQYNPGKSAFSDAAFHYTWDDDPGFTTSIDAALTLVPDGCYWVLAAGRTRPSEPLYGAVIYDRDDSDTESGKAECEGSAALALCIAALRARSAA